jgi:hypothetical protein
MDELRNQLARPLPRWLRTLRLGTYLALLAVVLRPFAVEHMKESRWVMPELIAREGWGYFFAFGCGLVVHLIGLRYRDGSLWLAVWVCASFVGGILLPAYATV